MAYGQPPESVYEAKQILTKLSGLGARDLFARMLFGEARGEILSGQVAVANVAMNRLKLGWYGHNIKDVILAPWQFSCFNENDPNLRLTASPPMREPYTICEVIAELALKSLLADNTGGATHYANLDVCNPAWITGDTMVRLCVIGRHTFFREVR